MIMGDRANGCLVAMILLGDDFLTKDHLTMRSTDVLFFSHHLGVVWPTTDTQEHSEVHTSNLRFLLKFKTNLQVTPFQQPSEKKHINC